MTTVGCSSIGSAPNQWPNAIACRSPSGDKGMSTSREVVRMTGSRAAVASSRATFPADSPCLTMKSVLGQTGGLTAWMTLERLVGEGEIGTLR